MALPLGDVLAGSILDFKFNTVDGGNNPITLAGTPAISVYKNNSTTESTAGITLTVDFDSRTGCHHVRIDTSSDGTFYSTGSEFDIVITAGTVSGISVVGVVVGKFSIQNKTVNVDRWKGVTPNGLIGGRVDSNAQVVGDKTSYALSSAGVQAIWDALTSALTTNGSIGKFIIDSFNSILNRIGAFTGSGDNTILGFFKALMTKSASTPSDLGSSTYDPSIHSIEASSLCYSSGTLISGGSSTAILPNSVPLSDTNGMWGLIAFDGGAGAGQARIIKSYYYYTSHLHIAFDELGSAVDGTTTFKLFYANDTNGLIPQNVIDTLIFNGGLQARTLRECILLLVDALVLGRTEGMELGSTEGTVYSSADDTTIRVQTPLDGFGNRDVPTTVDTS
jgi:hypothetical protein